MNSLVMNTIEEVKDRYLPNFASSPTNIYLLNVNNRNSRKMCKNMFKVNNKNTRTTSLVFLLLTLIIFNTFFQCFCL